MPGDYEGTTNEFKKSSISIPPELQSIIDKVTRYATTPISPSGGQTAAQGRALLGVGELIGGLQKQGMQDITEMKKLGITEAGTNIRLGITETGATARQNIATTPGLMRETRAGMEVPGSGSSIMQAGGVGEPELSLLEDWKHPAWNIGEPEKKKRNVTIDESKSLITNY